MNAVPGAADHSQILTTRVEITARVGFRLDPSAPYQPQCGAAPDDEDSRRAVCAWWCWTWLLSVVGGTARPVPTTGSRPTSARPRWKAPGA